MSELTPANQTNSRWWRTLTQNPVTIKELRSRMRGRRAFVLLTAYLVVMGTFVGLIYLSYAANSSGSTADARGAGQAVFATMLVVQSFLVVFVGPAFTAGAIVGEKERQTYDLLRTTLLSPHNFVLGKMISALSYVFLLQFAAIPLISLAFMLGGVALSEVIISQVLLGLGAITFAMLGMYFSSVMRTTMSASVSTYAAALFLTGGTPLLSLITLSIFGVFFTAFNPPDIFEALAIYVGLLAVATNLPATMIVSDIILREENSLWGFMDSAGGLSLWFFSPWYVYILLYALFTYFLFRRTVKKVSEIASS